MQETTFLRILTIILLLFSLWMAYTKEGFIHDNVIEGNTINVNMTIIMSNVSESRCNCPYYYPYFNYWDTPSYYYNLTNNSFWSNRTTNIQWVSREYSS